MSVLVPPIKSQGIKTKLVPWIKEQVRTVKYRQWIEPFMGTGVVAFNVQPKSALLCDTNPHIIRFYNALKSGEISVAKVKKHLEIEGDILLKSEGEHYYAVRERFNKQHNPLDFLFISRACFNGMMRFNRKGGFNVPFCRKPTRFAQALITKICNQVKYTTEVISSGDYVFKMQDFSETLLSSTKDDLIYCDPPYIDRHVDYYDSWNIDDENTLHKALANSQSKYVMSTWLKNKYRSNTHIFTIWSDCYIQVHEHFYHIGAKETHRNPMLEALLTNFSIDGVREVKNLDIDNLDLYSTPKKKFVQGNLFAGYLSQGE